MEPLILSPLRARGNKCRFIFSFHTYLQPNVMPHVARTLIGSGEAGSLLTGFGDISARGAIVATFTYMCITVRFQIPFSRNESSTGAATCCILAREREREQLVCMCKNCIALSRNGGRVASCFPVYCNYSFANTTNTTYLRAYVFTVRSYATWQVLLLVWQHSACVCAPVHIAFIYRMYQSRI